MKITTGKIISLIILCGVAAGLMWFVKSSPQSAELAKAGKTVPRQTPVEVMPIERGPIELLRTFSGALEPRAEFVVAPKVSGRVERMNVNIADSVKRGQVVGELDNDEYIQAVNQARADLAVSNANLAEARSGLEIANRELERVKTLRQRGVASESQFDASLARQLTKEVELEVAQAQLTHAQSALETANIKLGYTRISAGWSGGAEQRVVAERYVDEGDMVAANAPLLRIVELDPIAGVVFVAERDYAMLHPGQKIVLTTDAFPGEQFQGQVERIAPVFKQATRQARVELKIDNPGQRLKPGMFIRAVVVLDRKLDATIVPQQALIRRDDVTGLFLVSDDGRSVSWHEVVVGIRNGERVQVTGDGLSGRVVILGQQLLNDGAAITIPAEQSVPTAVRKEAVR
ncbi:MAG: efflux RND transporter periplasmic adaptor subunit [Desulfuromonadales bacterium]|nr:efflux RND transporter periplasmic adaptor subunit [Desulfuromonadales bacterium]